MLVSERRDPVLGGFTEGPSPLAIQSDPTAESPGPMIL